MRIHSLAIRNFRAVESFEVTGLGDFVLIAGPNGCGKSTVFDALRLLESVYVVGEWTRWFGLLIVWIVQLMRGVRET